MAEFKPGEAITTEVAAIEVTQNPEKPTLAPGRHSFQLIVEDDAGNLSLPDVVEVIVRDTILPTAVLDAPKLVQPGQSFFLNGKRSSDVAPGRLVRFEWTLLD
jgi:hypothetical protein